MGLNNFLTSGHEFSERECNLEFKFRVINSFMLIAMVFSAIFGALGDLGIADLGPIHPKVDYLYSLTGALLLIYLRYNKEAFRAVSWIMVFASVLTFTSVLVNVVSDEFRIIWFYFVIYIGYILLGKRAGDGITVAILFTILITDTYFELQLERTAFYTAVLGLIIASLLTRSYTLQMEHYEGRLKDQTKKAEEANRAKSLFLANMSHEIRTPINAVVGFSNVLLEQHASKLDKEQLEYVTHIHQSGEHLVRLINDVLDLSKIEANKSEVNLESFSLGESIQPIISVTEGDANKKDLEFSVNLSGSLPEYVITDRIKLNQILMNLLSNAVKFTPEGKVSLYIGRKGNNILISVSDTGIGVSNDQQGNIFQEFEQADISTTRKFGGSGLGLTITRKMAELLKGNISMTSTLGSGTTFEVLLPLVEGGEKEPPAVNDDKKIAIPPDSKILLVEDNRLNQKVVQAFLSRLGLQAKLADNGKLGLESVDAEKPDIVFMDIHMPEMDGIEATTLLRKKYSMDELPVIALTADAFPQQQDEKLSHNFNDYILKPISPEALEALLVQYLNNEQASKMPA